MDNNSLPENNKATKLHPVPLLLNPIVQPAYVNQMPVSYTPILPVAAVPQSAEYVSSLEPVYIDHLSRHKGQHLVVMTTAGKVEGTLTGVAVDHIQLDVEEGKALHIRIAQIVFFEGMPVSYR